MLVTRMRGDGLYDANSDMQRCILEAVSPLIDYAAVRAQIPTERTFTIVDYGCSEGRNSVESVKKIIRCVRNRDKSKWISVLHNDLPRNNFNRLFENLYANPQNSYLDSADDELAHLGGKVFAFASAASFYGRVAPDESVDFAISSSAAHWLSVLPDYSIRQHIFHAFAEPEEKRKLSRLAARDWQRFLLARAAEMASGARMVLTMGGRRLCEDGGLDDFGGREIFVLMNDVLKELVDEHRIMRAAYERFSLPIYCRSVEEVRAPFNDNQSPLPDQFTVEYAETHNQKCDRFERLRLFGAPSDYAEAVVETVRAYAQPVLEQGLFGTTEQLSKEHSKTLEILFSRMKDTIVKEPNRYVFEPVSLFVVLARN
ncbi:MAG: class I SAM-dependent methyltransferase [Candidatus Obscuribacterales bacterium]|nr:class I SAM-dependent methyltransferase [Candidatus Obscuribacterales bacterium]